MVKIEEHSKIVKIGKIRQLVKIVWKDTEDYRDSAWAEREDILNFI
jgi:hypothetical protein